MQRKGNGKATTQQQRRRTTTDKQHIKQHKSNRGPMQTQQEGNREAAKKQ